GESRNKLAAALAQSGRNEEAAGQLEEALLYTPNDPRVHRNLGRIYERLGRSEDAARHYRWASELETPAQPSNSANSSQAGPSATGPLR
ncbi:tetratricopeptide repeat protein, partial [Candidatus Sumerlaeota bacterium]|nr:tetratricopeptide repeat protein [Candidatus Sumerlaeota bacterium]